MIFLAFINYRTNSVFHFPFPGGVCNFGTNSARWLSILKNALSVERAKFQLKGEYDPSLKPNWRKNHKAKQKKTCEIGKSNIKNFL